MPKDYKKDVAKIRVAQSSTDQIREERGQRDAALRFLDPKVNKDKASFEETSEWDEFRRHVALYFPEVVDHNEFSANQALVAIAHASGWSNVKIHKASGLGEDTVSKWLKRPEVKYLINEFRLKTGDKNCEELVASTKHRGFKLMDYLLSLPPAVHDKDLLRIQVDLIKHVTKKDVGDADQNINVKGATTPADVLEEIHKLKQQGADLSFKIEDEEDIFDDA